MVNLFIFTLFFLISCVESHGTELEVATKTFYLQPVGRQDIPQFLEMVDILFNQQAEENGIFPVRSETKTTGMNQYTIDLIQSLKDNSFYANWKSQNFLYHIILSDSRIPCGYFWYSIDGYEAFIDAIFIEKKYRKLGVGTSVLSALETALRKQNFDLIRLHVFAHNEPACAFYRKLGYEVESRNGEISLNMRKSLKRKEYSLQ